jgi:hypothetical protein
MIFQRGQTYWYKFTWSIKQRDGSSGSFLIRRSARTKVGTEAEEVENEHVGRSAWAKFTHSIRGPNLRHPRHRC